MNNDQIIETAWFHGTDFGEFQSWIIPPPSKPYEPPIHKGIFFTSNEKYAKGAGQYVAETRLNKQINMLNTIYDKKNTENLRQIVSESNQIVATIDNIKYKSWHDGWISGDTLRIVLTENSSMLKRNITIAIENVMKENPDLSFDQATIIVLQLTTKNYIEIICDGARTLGFDAIFGYEVDRHSILGKKLAQPWLCVFDTSKITLPNWR